MRPHKVTIGDFIPVEFKEKVKKHKELLSSYGFFELKDRLHGRRDSFVADIDALRKELVTFKNKFDTWSGRFPEMNKYRLQGNKLIRSCYKKCDDLREKGLNRTKEYIRRYYQLLNMKGTSDIESFVKEANNFLEECYDLNIYSGNIYDNFNKYAVRMENFYNECLGPIPLDMQKVIVEFIISVKTVSDLLALIPTSLPISSVFAQLNRTWRGLMNQGSYQVLYLQEKTQWTNYICQSHRFGFTCAQDVFELFLSNDYRDDQIKFEHYKGSHTKELLRYHNYDKVSPGYVLGFFNQADKITSFMTPICKREIKRDYMDMAGLLKFGNLPEILDIETASYNSKRNKDNTTYQQAITLRSFFVDFLPFNGYSVYQVFCDFLGAFLHDYNDKCMRSFLLWSDSEESDDDNDKNDDSDSD